MKKILTLILISVIVIFVIGLVKDQVIKTVITVVGTQVTGAPLHINGFSLGVLRPAVRISGLRLYNPPGFHRAILVDIAKINVVYDIGALLKKRIHLVSAEVELKEMGLEKNAEGKLNADSLKVAKPAGKHEGKPSEQMPMQIDMLKLGIGKLVYKDYSIGKEPGVQVYDINLHKSYKNIKSVQELAALILSEPMKAAGIKGAAIYGVSVLAGAAILPVAVVATFAGKDSAQQDFDAAFDNVYEIGLSVLKKMGKVTTENKDRGIVGASINSADVTLKLNKISNLKTQVTVSVRKYLLPKPEIAAGVLYEISEKLR